MFETVFITYVSLFTFVSLLILKDATMPSMVSDLLYMLSEWNG